MGDYVLESSPALERLIERLRAQDDPPPPEEISTSNLNSKRSRWGRRAKVHAADHPEVSGADPIAACATDPGEGATVAEPAAIAEDEPAEGEDDTRSILDDPHTADEMILVDFDEEPAVFDEEPEDQHAVADEADEMLDVYEDEMLDVYGDEEGDGEDEIDEAELVLGVSGNELPNNTDRLVPDLDEEEDVDDEEPVEILGAFGDEETDDEQIADEEPDDEQIADEEPDDEQIADEEPSVLVDNRHEGGEWILDAFELWKLQAVEDDADHNHHGGLKAFDQVEADADEVIDVPEEDSKDPVQVAEPPEEPSEVPIAALEPTVEDYVPYQLAPSAPSLPLNPNAGRKKARHRKQSPRQRRRSLKRAEQDAMKAAKSSMKAAAKSSKKAVEPGLSQNDLRAESSSVLSA